MKVVSRLSVASTALAARGPIFTNHWIETSGSTIVSHLWQRASGTRWLFSPRRRPCASRSRRTFLRASARSRPAYAAPAAGVIRPSNPMTVTRSSPWRLPASKSFGSCAGVTLTIPVPNSLSTKESAITGMVRPVSGSVTRLPTSAGVALVVGVHGDRGVAEHRLGPRRRDDDLPAAHHGVRDRPQVPGRLDVVHLEVGEDGRAARAPVHEPLGAIGEALLVERREREADGARADRVERVVLAGEVARAAEPPDLVEDVSAARVRPLAAERDERVAAEVVARLARPFPQVALDDHLRRDAGVVDAGDPEDGAPLHAAPAAQDVLERPPERVTDVQPPRDVRRRDHDRERLGVPAGGLGTEDTGLLLRLVPAHLEGGRVEGLLELLHRLPRISERRISSNEGRKRESEDPRIA